MKLFERTPTAVTAQINNPRSYMVYGISNQAWVPVSSSEKAQTRLRDFSYVMLQTDAFAWLP